MKNDKWDEPIYLKVDRLGECAAWHRFYNDEYHQWKMRYGLTEVVGDYNFKNERALDNALGELKKHFKTIFSNN